MKAVSIVLEKIYWLMVILVPLLPPYVYATFPSVRSCNTDGICFESGGAIINGDGEAIFFLSLLLLWPLCVWHLVGKHVVTWRPRLNFSEESLPKVLLIFVQKFYWLIVAFIPLLFWYIFGTFFAPHNCHEDRSCLQFYLPLSMESKTAVLVACFLLWPLCARKLIGNGRAAQ